METLTYQTPAGLVHGTLQTWLSSLIDTMSPEGRAKVLEMVKQRESDKVVLINPDGTTTTVLRAQKGHLAASGKEIGEG